MTKIRLLSAVVFVGSLAIGQAHGQSEPPASVDASLTQGFEILLPKVSRALKIARIPGGTNAPFIIGNYWACSRTPIGTLLCKLKLVVCNEEQTSCVQIN